MSDPCGASGRSITPLLTADEREPAVLAALVRGGLRPETARLARR